MTCPSCGYQLQKLSVTTDSGGRFDVDHCGRCGGTWFDPYEINRVPYHEVLRLAKLTVLPLKQPTLLPKRVCPSCHKELVHFSSESLPAKTKLLRCPKCHGIWASQRTLEEFKNHQEETVQEYKEKGLVFPALSVVFVPALFSALLFLTTFFTINSLQESKEFRTKAVEILDYETMTPISNSTIILALRTKTQVLSFISYGTSTLEMKKEIISKLPSYNHTYRITGLSPNTTYIYSLTFEDETGKRFTTSLKQFNCCSVNSP